MRHTTFRFALDPTPAQAVLFARHAGASRFAYNQCLRLVTEAVEAKSADPSVVVPWSGFDLINAINAWKKTEGAGRVFVVASDGTITKMVTGLAWRHEVAAQVLEEAGEPVITPRAKVLFATISRHGARWYVSLNLQAPDVHPRRRHAGNGSGFVGIDRGLAAFVVMATAGGTEVGRIPSPKHLQRNLVGLRRRSRAVLRAQPRSHKRAKAVRRLSRRHARIADSRRNFLHEVSSQLVKTHDRLCLEDLAIANLIRNKHLARAIGDAAWAEFARQLAYKSDWFGAELVICDRWFPSTKTCSRCGQRRREMGLAERIFSCDGCGLAMDRDRNAAANLAAWAEAASRAAAQAPVRQAGGRDINAPGGEGAGHCLGDGGTGPRERGTDAHAFRAYAEGTREGWCRLP